LSAVPNRFLRDPPGPWVRFFFMMPLLRRATVVRREIYMLFFFCFCNATIAWWLVPLQATASSFRYPTWFWALFFLWWRRSAASFRSLCLFFFGSDTSCHALAGLCNK
jgi:hypothetical protein